MDLRQFYGQCGQLESLAQVHRMLMFPFPNGDFEWANKELQRALRREKLVRQNTPTTVPQQIKWHRKTRIVKKRAIRVILKRDHLEEAKAANEDFRQQTKSALKPLKSEQSAADMDQETLKWRAAFDASLSERYQNFHRRRNLLDRCTMEQIIARLEATKGMKPCHLALPDLTMRERYTLGGSGNGNVLLLQTSTGREYVCLEQMFDVLHEFHCAEQGDQGRHEGSRKAMYLQLRGRYANLSKMVVSLFLRGCPKCQQDKKKRMLLIG